MANEIYKSLNRIKELRIKKGDTQDTVAKAIGVSQGMLTNYETGKRSPRDERIWENLASYFNVSKEYIMGLTNENALEDDSYELKEFERVTSSGYFHMVDDVLERNEKNDFWNLLESYYHLSKNDRKKVSLFAQSLVIGTTFDDYKNYIDKKFDKNKLSTKKDNE